MRKDLPSYMLALLISVRMLAQVETKRGSTIWAAILVNLDDCIERAIAEKVSIGVTPILYRQVSETIGKSI